MESTILNELQKNTNEPCVSIILPTHRKSPERTQDELSMSSAVEKATQLLHFKYGKNGDKISRVIENLERMTQEIDYLHNDKGLGIFVSTEISRTVKFPFEVEEKIIVGENFEVRDMLYLSEYLMDYYVLVLSEKSARLMKGNGEKLEEIKDNNFPIKFHDDYEYVHSSHASSYGYSLKSTEKDKSIIREERLISNLKASDKKLSTYITKVTPLIIAGVNKEIGYFMKITTNAKFVVGKVKGNFSHNSFHHLGELAFDQIKIYLDKEAQKLLIRLDIAVGKKLAAIGIEETWYASKEGKGLVLLIEKDHACPGFVTGDKLNLSKPALGKPYKIVTDVVDEIMETVLKKNGKVAILQNGMLKNYDGIALIERY